jgi:AraC-like DNA-binding protein
MQVQFDTHGAPPRQRLALWQDIVCDVFVQLDCKSDLGPSFHGSVARSMLGPVACTEVATCRQRVFRTPSRIARAHEEFVLVALGVEGAGAVLQDGREAVIRPGEFALYDTTRPYELRFDADFVQTIFQIPRALLQRRIGALESVTATTFAPDRPVERLTFDFLLGLSRAANQVGAEAGMRLSEQGLDLLALALSERLEGAPLSPSTHRSALLHRLKAYIETHLPDPDLSLATAAVALGISPRYVNNLLAEEQISFRRYLLARRLEQCRRSLAAHEQAHRHVGEIAFAWGFNDLAHFSHAFKAAYGLSPRDFRLSQPSLQNPNEF